VLILRETTERPELVASGGGRLIGTESAAIIASVDELRADEKAYASMRSAPNPFGDGFAAERIKDILIRSINES